MKNTTNAVAKMAVAIAAAAAYALIMVKCVLVIKEALDIISQSPSLKSQASGALVGAGTVAVFAAIAFVGALQDASQANDQRKTDNSHCRCAGQGLKGRGCTKGCR